MEDLWPVITIVGPVVLAGVILWAMLRNRASSRAEIARTEEATHRLYEQEDRAEHAEDDRVER